MKLPLLIVEGPGKITSVYLNNYRIAGIKPLGGGKTILELVVNKEDILQALGGKDEHNSELIDIKNEYNELKEELSKLKKKIEQAWIDYQALQDMYRYYTGKDYGWLR